MQKFVKLIFLGLLTFCAVFTVANAQMKVDNMTITKNVQSKLSSESSLSNKNITVTTKDGVVNLSGSLDNDTQATTAVQIAESVPGVKDVETKDLKVANSNGGQTFKDALTTAKVKGLFLQEKLFGDVDVPVFSIMVETKKGVVFLTGTVDNAAQRTKAVALAKSLKEVKKVNNKVQVKAVAKQ